MFHSYSAQCERVTVTMKGVTLTMLCASGELFLVAGTVADANIEPKKN